jgi:hypothetical protein
LAQKNSHNVSGWKSPWTFKLRHWTIHWVLNAIHPLILFNKLGDIWEWTSKTFHRDSASSTETSSSKSSIFSSTGSPNSVGWLVENATAETSQYETANSDNSHLQRRVCRWK